GGAAAATFGAGCGGDGAAGLEAGPPRRVEILPRHIRLLERRELLHHSVPQAREIPARDPCERLQAVTEGIEPAVGNGVHGPGDVEPRGLPTPRNRVLERFGAQAQLLDLR